MIDKTFNQVEIKPEMILGHLALYFTQDCQGLASYIVKISLLLGQPILTTTSNRALHKQMQHTRHITEQNSSTKESKYNIKVDPLSELWRYFGQKSSTEKNIKDGSLNIGPIVVLVAIILLHDSYLFFVKKSTVLHFLEWVKKTQVKILGEEHGLLDNHVKANFMLLHGLFLV